MTTLEIPLTNSPLCALIDAADLPLVAPYTWHLSDGYARSGRKLLMHRLLCAPPAGCVVDHISGERLDNRRANLRVATLAQNNANRGSRAPYKGVHLYRRSGKWSAQIRCQRVIYYLGVYPDPETAAKVYDAAARHYHGAFARTNFPGDDCRSAAEIMAAYRRERYYSVEPGVTWHKNWKRWQVLIGGQYVGEYATEAEAVAAARAYNCQRSTGLATRCAACESVSARAT